MNACVWDGACGTEDITAWRCILQDPSQWGAAPIQVPNLCCVLQLWCQDLCCVGILLIVPFTTALHQGCDLRVLLNDIYFVYNSNFSVFDIKHLMASSSVASVCGHFTLHSGFLMDVFWSWSKSNYWNVSSAVLCTKVGTSEPRRFTAISKHHFVLVCHGFCL